MEMRVTTDRQTGAWSAWFAGPKSENGEWFADTIRRVTQDYHSWRRNYFPEDGVVVDSSHRRRIEEFRDRFDDRLLELLARLKCDFPFYSPRYAAHMLAEQTLPGIAGYFAAMLYNPNNVSSDAAPVTVRLELEASQLIARMLGYGPQSWAHLTGGGTIANIEALWIARSVRYLPFVIEDIRRTLGLGDPPWAPGSGLKVPATAALEDFAACFADARRILGDGHFNVLRVIDAYRDSRFNIGEHGVAPVSAAVNSRGVILAPETYHYCFSKAADALGLGRRQLLSVKVGPGFRMEIDDLERTLDRVQAAGDHVIAVVAAVGTTEEGAIDPVDEILNLRARREAAGQGSFWLHADAAYGGYFRTMVTPSRLGLGDPVADAHLGGEVRRIPLRLPERTLCAALERLGECDSITVDPHKLGCIPYPAGAVCFRSNLVKPIARQEAPYIEGPASDVQAERSSDAIGVYILEGSKPGAAAAAVWLSHTLIPLDITGHGLLMQEMIRSACELHALLDLYPQANPGLGVRAVFPCPPPSNIVCYAFRPAAPGASLRSINDLNRRVYSRFTLRAGERVYNQSFFVSHTEFSSARYSASSIAPCLEQLGVSTREYQAEGLFLLRSVLMNPWYSEAKRRGRYFLSELAGDLYTAAQQELQSAPPPVPSRR
jgi:glutamate/tyrosine decarboxylase-like PLP-dependent enzyme